MSQPPKSLPPIQVKEPAVRRALEAIKEIVEIGEGVRGNRLDKKLTIRDLRDAGIIEYIQRANFNAATDITPVTENPILTVPPAPTGFDVVPGIGVIFLNWDAARYGNHAYTNIYRSTEDNFANAEVVSQASFTTYMDSAPFQVIDEETGQLQGYYYWITHVSDTDVEGPPNATEGTYSEPELSPDYLLDLLQDRIDENLFVQSLRDRIDLIDVADTGLIDRLAEEIQNRVGLQVDFYTNKSDLSLLSESLLQSLIDVGEKVFILESRVNKTVNGRTIEQVADRVDSIRNHISGEVGSRKAEAEAIKTNIVLLETSIDDTNGLISSQATEIDSLQTSVSLVDSKADANATTITTLNSDIDDINDTVSSHATQLTQIEADVTSAQGSANSALSQIVDLSSDIDDINGTVSSQATQIATLNTNVSNAQNSANSALGQIVDLSSDIDDINGTVSSQATQIATLNTNVSNAQNSANSALGQITTLDSDIDTLSGTVSSQGSTLVTLSSEVSGLDNDINGAGGVVATLANTNAVLGTKASASSVTNVYSYIDDEVAAIEVSLDTVADAITGTQSKYSVKVDANGAVAGFGLIATDNEYDEGDGHTEAYFSVDTFAIVSPGSGALQFFVEGGNVTMPGANIANASITSAKIASLAANKITAGTINVALTLNAATINGGQLNIGGGNFVVDSAGNLTANNAYIRGNIQATSVTTGSVNTSGIQGDAVSDTVLVQDFTNQTWTGTAYRTLGTLYVPYGADLVQLIFSMNISHNSSSIRGVAFIIEEDVGSPPHGVKFATGEMPIESGYNISFSRVFFDSPSQATTYRLKGLLLGDSASKTFIANQVAFGAIRLKR